MDIQARIGDFLKVLLLVFTNIILPTVDCFGDIYFCIETQDSLQLDSGSFSTFFHRSFSLLSSF